MRKLWALTAKILPGGSLNRGLVISGLLQIAGLTATTVVGVVLARGLGVEDYGRFGIALAVLALLCVPGELGLAKLVMREVGAASVRGDEQTLINATIWSSRTALLTSAVIIIITAAILLARNGSDWSLTDYSILLGLPLVPITVLTAIRAAALMGLNRVLRGQLPFQLIRPALFATLVLALFTFDPNAGPSSAMVMNVIATAVAFAAVSYWLRQLLPKGTPYRAHRQGPEWLVSSVWIASIDALIAFQAQVGVLLLGLLATSADAGIFRVAASAAVVVSLPVALVEIVSAPLFARRYGARDMEGLQQLATRSVQIGFGAFLITAIMAVLFGKPFIGLLFGEEYLPAYEPFLILCLARATNAMFGMSSVLLMMTGRERQFAGALAAAVAVNLALAAILAPVIGASGAAIGGLGYFLVWSLFAWRKAGATLGIRTAIWQSLRLRRS